MNHLKLKAAVSASCSTERIRIQRSIFPLLIVLVCLSAAAIAQKAPPSKPFERFDGCVLEPDEWTDGDSFRVRLPDSRLETFRLYFVDTTEIARRKNQRRLNARRCWKTAGTWDYCLAKAVCTVRRSDFPRRCACTNKTPTFCWMYLDRAFSAV